LICSRETAESGSSGKAGSDRGENEADGVLDRKRLKIIWKSPSSEKVKSRVGIGIDQKVKKEGGEREL
jgi:hypothetical protein